MKAKLRSILAILVLVGFIVYFALNREAFTPLLHLNLWLLGAIALADVVSITISGIFTRVVLVPFKRYISLKESVYVSLISSVGNFFAPAGAGFAFRAAYLKKRHDLSYKDYVATLYGNYIIVFLVNSAFGLVALYFLRNQSHSEWFVLVLVFAGIFAGSLLLSLIKIPSTILERDIKNRFVGKVAKILFQMLEGWNRIVGDKVLMTKLALIVAFNFGLSLAIAYLEITALHLSIGFPALLLFSVLGSLSLFVSITPANLGVKEAIFLFSSTVIGFSVSQILSIALIDRGVLFAVLVLLWLAHIKIKLPAVDATVSNKSDS